MGKNERGITLIALVVTIVVLLILAGVSISMLTGENGIINQANDAKEATEQAKIEEKVDLAVNSLISKNNGNTNNITPQMIADEINKTENRNDVYAEGSIFPTNIIFQNEGRKASVTIEKNWDTHYSVNITKDDIVSPELFSFEIINTEEKQVKITKINEEYYIEDTFYSIQFDGLTDTLVIPYQVEGSKVEGGIADEYYTVTEVSLVKFSDEKRGNTHWRTLPVNIENIIYPNTVTKIYAGDNRFQSQANYKEVTEKLKKVVLSNKIEEIPNYFFIGCHKLEEIIIPEGVKTIGKYVFDGCESLDEVTFPSTIETISKYAFASGETDTEEKHIKINIKKSENSVEDYPWGAINAEIQWNYK